MATNELVKQGTLLDIMNQIGPDGNLLAVAEVLQKETPMLKDAVWVEANDTVQHVYSRRTSLPKSEMLQYNKGVNGNIGTTEQVTSGLSARGNRPWYDARLVDLAPNKAEYRNQQSRAVIMGIGQEFESDIIYGNKASDSAKFDGIESYVDTLTNNMVVSGGNGDGDKNTSAYVVCWDVTNGAFMAYPRGTTAGVKYEDKGKRSKDMGDGSTLEVYEDYVEVSGGLCVADKRAIGRYCNIDVTDPVANTFDENKLILLLNRLPAMLRSKAVIYVSRSLKAAIEIRMNSKENAYYTRENVFGEQVTMFQGTPIRLDEMISETETAVA
jgi:hypothetical protein